MAAQSVSSASTSVDIVSTMTATFSSSAPTIQLDSAGTGSAALAAIADDVANQIHIEGLPANWQLGNGTEVIGESGRTLLNGSGTGTISIDFINRGWLDVIPMTPREPFESICILHLWKVVQIQQRTTTMRTHKSMMAVVPMTIRNWCL